MDGTVLQNIQHSALTSCFQSDKNKCKKLKSWIKIAF